MAKPAQRDPIPDDKIVAPPSVFDEMSEEEILMWATPRYDEIQAQKEAHQQRLEEEKDLRNP
jgi:hypothetical protein